MLTTIQKPDAEIEKQVIQELRWDCRTETSPITVSVTEGVVMLGGRVKYYGVKHAAEEAAHRIAGVATVHNAIDIRMPPAEFRADCEIADEVRNAFEWNVLVPHEQLSVMVDNGIVTLTGTVACISQREEAERAVINLLGVKGIVNNIAVWAQPLEAETVCAAIADSLERQAIANAREVTVEVGEGAIRLSGSVPTWNHRRAAVTAAGFAHGARRVVDDLHIAAGA